jgi:hypothetical protein
MNIYVCYSKWMFHLFEYLNIKYVQISFILTMTQKSYNFLQTYENQISHKFFMIL